VPALEGADEGKFADALVWVVAVKDGEALVVGEAGFTKSFDEGGELVAGEKGLGGDGQGAKVEDGAIDAAFAAGASDGVEEFFAGVEVKVLVGVEADELGGADDLEIEGHLLREVHGLHSLRTKIRNSKFETRNKFE
jgi:hypothetical protein